MPVSTIAAASPRFSGTSSVDPSREIASRSGQLSVGPLTGGKSWGAVAVGGGGTGIMPVSVARPVAV